jgi:hypothetical protein
MRSNKFYDISENNINQKRLKYLYNNPSNDSNQENTRDDLQCLSRSWTQQEQQDVSREEDDECK